MQNDIGKKNEDWFKTWFDTKYYHSLYEHRDDNEAVYFIERLIEHLNLNRGADVMDLACGKGRHSITLFDAGFNVTGLDLSQNSIEHLKPMEREGLEFQQWDMRERFRESAYDVVFNLFTSFGYFEEKKDDLRVIDAIHYALRENGVLVLDYLNAAPLMDNEPHVGKEILRDGYVFNTTKKIEDGKVVKEIRVTDQGEEHEFRESVQLLTLDDFKSMFLEVGLKLEKVFGDYQLGPFHPEESPRLIMIASKK